MTRVCPNWACWHSNQEWRSIYTDTVYITRFSIKLRWTPSLSYLPLLDHFPVIEKIFDSQCVLSHHTERPTFDLLCQKFQRVLFVRGEVHLLSNTLYFQSIKGKMLMLHTFGILIINGFLFQGQVRVVQGVQLHHRFF